MNWTYITCGLSWLVTLLMFLAWARERSRANSAENIIAEQYDLIAKLFTVIKGDEDIVEHTTDLLNKVMGIEEGPIQ